MDAKFDRRFQSFCNSLDALAEARERDLRLCILRFSAAHQRQYFDGHQEPMQRPPAVTMSRSMCGHAMKTRGSFMRSAGSCRRRSGWKRYCNPGDRRKIWDFL